MMGEVREGAGEGKGGGGGREGRGTVRSGESENLNVKTRFSLLEKKGPKVRGKKERIRHQEVKRSQELSS